jgi:DNA segregation ATPase FtsK/SpoIIIE-like protein
MLFSPGGSPKPMRLQGCFVRDPEVERLADCVRSQAKANYVKTDFLTKEEQDAQRMRASQTVNNDLAMDGIDADDGGIARDDSDGDDYDYTYQQERRDGRDLKTVLGVSAAPGNVSHGSSRSTEDTDAIDDELFQQAVRLILTHRKASVSLMQRKLKIGFARAGRVMDMLEDEGIVGPNVGSKVREILVDPDEYLAKVDEEDEERF